MQVLHDTSDEKKKPMKIVPEGDTEKMEELNTEEAIETMEAIDPEETTDAVDENQEAETTEEEAGAGRHVVPVVCDPILFQVLFDQEPLDQPVLCHSFWDHCWLFDQEPWAEMGRTES